MGPKLLLSADATFLLGGIIFSCCWRDVKSLDEMEFMEAPMLNKAVVFTYLKVIKGTEFFYKHFIYCHLITLGVS